MDVEQLKIQAFDAAFVAVPKGQIGDMMVLVGSGKMPKGFPRGELLNVTDRGRARGYDPLLVLKWIRDSVLIPEMMERHGAVNNNNNNNNNNNDNSKQESDK